MYTNRVFGTTKRVLFSEVSSFQGVLISEVPLYSGTVLHVCGGIGISMCIISRASQSASESSPEK